MNPSHLPRFATIGRKILVTAAVAFAGTLGTGAALARGGDVQWSVTIGVPAYHVPAYRPVPVYTQPVPVYRYYPHPPARYKHHHWQRHHPHGDRRSSRWDHDGDGIPNRRDPVYNPRWDVDGDGIPNRRDPVYNPRWDRDREGIPRRHHRDHDRHWRER